MSVEPTPAAESQLGRIVGLWRRRGNLILVASVLVGILTLATVPWPGKLRLSGRLISSSITMVLDDELRINPDLDFERGELRLSGLRSLQPPPEISTELIEAANVTLRAKRITLTAMRLDPGAELTLDAAPRAAEWLSAVGGAGSLQFEAEGPLSMLIRGQWLTTDATPLALSANAGGSRAKPLVVVGAPTQGLNFQELPTAPDVSFIRFGRRAATPDFGATFVSAVVSGAIQLVDVERDVKLSPGAWVKIDGFRGHIFELEKSGAGYSVGFSGAARRVAIGPAGFAEDMAPSCLEYLYHQQWLKLLWLGALAGFAVLAKVQSWLAGKFD